MHKTLPSWLILTAIIAMDILAGMEFDLFTPSFPEIQNYFNLTPFWTEALLSINFAGYGLGLFCVGALADRYGRKPIIIIGLIIFIVGSVLCAVATSYTTIFMGRFLQGIGVAAPAILSFLIIADGYPLAKQQFLMAMINGLKNTSVAAAPIVGSYITSYFQWQGNFHMLLILGLITLGLTILCLPKTAATGHKECTAFSSYVTIFKSKMLMLLIVNFVVMCAVYWVFVGMSPLLYMQDLGVSLRHFGYYQGVLAFVFAVGCVGFGLIIKRYDQKKMLTRSLVISVVGLVCISYTALTDSHNPMVITLAIVVFIIGQIIPCTILYPLSLNFIPEAKGKVAAVNQAGQLIVSAIGLQLAGYCYQGSFQSIGVIMIVLIMVGVATLYWIIKDYDSIQRNIDIITDQGY